MTTAEHPITRSELREELTLLRQEFREHYATKADLEKVKGDLTYRMIFIQLAGMAAVAAIMRFLG